MLASHHLDVFIPAYEYPAAHDQLPLTDVSDSPLFVFVILSYMLCPRKDFFCFWLYIYVESSMCSDQVGRGHE